MGNLEFAFSYRYIINDRKRENGFFVAKIGKKNLDVVSPNGLYHLQVNIFSVVMTWCMIGKLP